MDDPSTFLEFPLDREVYTRKETFLKEKPPLRILLTEAGSKVALNLMYKICRGEVFGSDQKVILHLINTKGSVIQQKAFLLELEDCGFAALAEIVVSVEPEKTYGNVDFVIAIALFEELAGHPLCNSFLYQLNKIRNVARNVRMFARPDTKMVICSPSTKGVAVLMTCVKIFEENFPTEYVSGVTCLDEAIAKSFIGAELKRPSDKIKNVVIWGSTFPDVKHATISMYSREDLARYEEVDISVLDAVGNDNWFYTRFVPGIYKRVLKGNLAKHGMAVASATVEHLKVLYYGSDSREEIMSMAIIIPPDEPYGILKNLGFSVPVTTENGRVKVRMGVPYQTSTRLMLHKIVYKLQYDLSMIAIYNLIKFMKDYEEKTGEQFVWTEHINQIKKDAYSPQLLSYLISPMAEEQAASERTDNRRKSIVWEDSHEESFPSLSTTVNFRKKNKRQS